MNRAEFDISIITPSYNQGEYISRTLQSIIDQVDPLLRMQYILMDGGSTDPTPVVVKKYLPRLRRKGIDVTYISQHDAGQSDAINKGMQLARGTIVTYLNSDDYYEPNVLRPVVEFFEKNPEKGWAYGGWNFVNQSGNIFRSYQHQQFRTFLFRSYAYNIGQPAVFWRRSIGQQVGPFRADLHLAMDYDYWLRLLAACGPPSVLPIVIANLRYYADAKSAKYVVKHNVQAYQVAARHAKGDIMVQAHAAWRFLLGRLAIAFRRNVSQTVRAD